MNEQDFKRTIFSLAAQDLTIHQIVALLLSEGDNIIMRDLAEATGTTGSNVTGTVSRMVDKGLLRRTPCTKDRRKIIITITPKGMKALSSLRAKL